MKTKARRLFGIISLSVAACSLQAQESAALLLQQARTKLESVKDYQAGGDMKTNIPFLKVPLARVKVFFRSPDKLKIINEKGVSLVPKEAETTNLRFLLSGNCQVVDAGRDTVNGSTARVIKLLPTDTKSDIVLSTVYINEQSKLTLRIAVTSREHGTSELDLFYGRYSAWALPDKSIFSFNAGEYKMPRGVTFDYDDGRTKKPAAGANQRGTITIIYTGYIINKGIPDKLFE